MKAGICILSRGRNNKDRIMLTCMVLLILNTAVSQTTVGDLHYVSAKTQSPFSICSVDMDNDGDNDIISGSSTDTIAWYENLGDGIFSPAIKVSTAMDNIRWVDGCDLDLDGDIDILSASKNDNTIAWFENDGNENFGSPNIVSNNANTARYVAGYDMDNDNDIDIVASYYSKIVWYENEGNCNFGAGQIISNRLSYRLCIADLNDDTYRDICTMSTTGDGLIWYKNNGDKTFTEKIVIVPFDQDYLYDIDIADVNGNGHLDIVASFRVNSYYGKIVWFENEGNDSFTDSNDIYFKYGEYESIASGDFDADGDADIFATSSYNDILFWIRNVDLSFYSDEIASNMAVSVNILIADMDMDSDLDIVVSSSNRSKIVWFENLTLEILSQPQDMMICPLENTSFSISINDAITYSWQVKKTGEAHFYPVEDDETYSGTNSTQLQITKPDLSMNGFQYRFYGTNGSGTIYSDTVKLMMYDDFEAPYLEVKNTELFLSENIQVLLSEDSVIDSLYDNCLITETTLSKNIFDCSDLGKNTIDVTAIDGSDNMVSKAVAVNVIDTISPIIKGFGNEEVFFTEGSTYIIDGSNMAGMPVVYDNCILSSVINDYTHTESIIGAEFPVGKTIVIWTATDNSGNFSNWYLEITVINENNILVYPNPCVDYFTVEQQTRGAFSMKMFDLDGKLILRVDEITDSKYTLSTASLLQGTYIVQIDNGLEVKEVKLQKIK